jgi:hypothetical protein
LLCNGNTFWAYFFSFVDHFLLNLMRYLKLLAFLVTLSVFTNSSAQNVLVEAFTNTGCQNCIATDGPLDQYVASHPNVLLVYVHDDFPSPKDPFYKESQSSARYRTYTFWAVGADPQAYVNGTDAATSWQSWKSNIQTATTSYSATISFSPVMDNGKVQLTVHCTGTSSGQAVRLNVALIESGISYNNTDLFGNPNNVPIWDNVFRQMLPADAGSAPFTLSGSQDFTVMIDTTGHGWNLANMKAIAFLQQDISSLPTDAAPVLGLGVLDLSTLGISATKPNYTGASFGIPSPNPFTSLVNLPFEISHPGDVRIELLDILGRTVASTPIRFVGEGQSTFSIVGENLGPGIYEARLFFDGVFTATTKVVSVR